jgi:hypothetical protein
MDWGTMGIGDETSTATARLRLLRQEYATPGLRQPGPRTRSAPQPRPSEPADLGIIDHVAQAGREIVARTRELVPDAGPAPADDADKYEWMRRKTSNLAPEQLMTRDAMLMHHSLKHAIAAGDEDAVRWEACPLCDCWSLFWQRDYQRVYCANSECTDRWGQPSMWTLDQLAESLVAVENARSVAAT